MRELENILERAITHSSPPTAKSAPPTSSCVKPPTAPTRATAAADVGALAGSLGDHALGEHLEEVEREAIIKALEATRYNKTAAAKALGMSFRALRYRIKKLGIE